MTPIQTRFHNLIKNKQDDVIDWFIDKRKGYAFPFYMSFDIRDSGYKVAPVDANIYPAGFNNICPTDREASDSIINGYINAHYGSGVQNIALLCEEHTNNLFYWDNVRALKEMIEQTGRQVRLVIPKDLDKSMTLKSASGVELTISAVKKESGTLTANDGFKADLIISNNDFSESHESWAKGIDVPINPPRELGWYQRRKSTHFKYYNELAAELANVIGAEPWELQVDTDVLFDCDLGFPENRERAAAKADEMIKRVSENYKARGIKDEPVLFIKNNSGTYGLAVAQVKSGDEILAWNNKARTKMKAAKGGRGVDELLFQEGIPTALQVDGKTCEPAIYMVGCELVGGFLRTHGEKGPNESLNSPGAIYKRLCVTDLKINVDGSPMENVYGWAARVSSLAVGREAREMGVVYTKYNVDGSVCTRNKTEY